MSNEPNKPIPAQELTDKELEGIEGGLSSFDMTEDRLRGEEAFK